MKRILLLLPCLALALLLCSCIPTSINPLGTPEAAAVDPRLEGDWGNLADPQKRLTFTAKDAPWMHAVVDDLSGPAKDDAEYMVYPTTVGKTHFLNIQPVEKDEKGNPKKAEDNGYMFARYEIAPDGTLSIWTMNESLVTKAIEAGTLKGTVKNKGSDTGKNIQIKSSTAKLLSFIEKTGANKVFDKEFGAYRKSARVKPIDITVTPAQITLDAAPVTLDELEEKLAKQKATSGAAPVVIRFAPETPVGFLMDIHQRVSQSHSKVHLVFKDPQQGGALKELTITDPTARYLDFQPAENKD